MSIGHRVAVGLLALGVVSCTSEPAPTQPTTPSVSAAPTAPSVVWALVEGGWSFGMCARACITSVAFSGDGSASLTVADRLGEGSRNYEGQLTPSGLAQLSAAGLDDVGSIDRTYGCPDCADGGASRLTWANGGDRFSTTYEYRSPPPMLQEQDRFVRRVIETLWACGQDRYVKSTRPFAGCRTR